jgi:hypothetical protein
MSFSSPLITVPTQDIPDFAFVCVAIELYRENPEVACDQPYTIGSALM